MKNLIRDRMLVVALAAGVLAVVGLPGASRAAQGTQVEPPAPPNLYALLSEEDLIAQLPGRMRTGVEGRRDARGRYEALLDASDILLTSIAARDSSMVSTLQLYEAVLVAADRRLRSPEANVRPRDRIFKRYERRLSTQLGQLKALIVELSHGDVDTGVAITERVTRLRLGALNSALDIDSNILRVPEEKP